MGFCTLHAFKTNLCYSLIVDVQENKTNLVGFFFKDDVIQSIFSNPAVKEMEENKTEYKVKIIMYLITYVMVHVSAYLIIFISNPL